MALKYSLNKYLAKNSRLVDAFYNIRKPQDERIVSSLSEEMSKYDTIQDISSLLYLKNRIKNDGQIWFSHNAGMSDYRLYGIGETLFGSLSDRLYNYPSIEHGLIFFEKTWSDLELTGRATCITFGSFRKSIIRRYLNIPVFSIGPYIQYARPYYDSESFKCWKKKLGKVLLVFPTHCTNDACVRFFVKDYINEIEKYAKNYNSVVICSYFWDIDNPLIEAFRNQGYIIVSAGYREDKNFLRRLRTIIESADYVLSDSIGTHIGYCYKLEKKVGIIHVNTELTEETSDFREEQLKMVANVIESNNIQLIERIMDYYWGNSISLGMEDFKLIKEINTELSVDSRYWWSSSMLSAERFLAKYKIADTRKYELLKMAME